MPTITVDLSTKSINSAIRALKRVENEFAKPNSHIQQLVREEAADILKDDVQRNVNTVINADGNAFGEVYVFQAYTDTYVRWKGEQISFLEFGTGYQGAKQGMYRPYPDPAIHRQLNYDPKEHGWAYFDGNEWVPTWGIPAYAPMYLAALGAEKSLSMNGFARSLTSPINRYLKELLSDG